MTIFPGSLYCPKSLDIFIVCRPLGASLNGFQGILCSFFKRTSKTKPVVLGFENPSAEWIEDCPLKIATDSIRIEGKDLAVRFKKRSHQYNSFKELIVARLSGKFKAGQYFEALKGVSVRIYAGEVVGLIGHNGSGKSTLLKVLCGVLSPGSGQIYQNGRIASLIELGAGFDGELSGRENVLLNLALLGVSKTEAEGALPQVLEFADLEAFANEPVKNYSSGMQARLGFACATVFRPDILIVDEVLAVGDENFQRKCLAHMHKLRRQGTSIVLVSHDLNTVEQFCERVYVLDHGKVVFEGHSEKAVHEFRKLLLASENRKISEGLGRNSDSASSDSMLRKVEAFVSGLRPEEPLTTGQPWQVEVVLEHSSECPVDNLTVGISVHESSTGTHLGGIMAEEANSHLALTITRTSSGETRWLFRFKSNTFHSGRYHIDVRAYRNDPRETLLHMQKLVSFDCRFAADPINPHRNFIALGACL